MTCFPCPQPVRAPERTAWLAWCSSRGRLALPLVAGVLLTGCGPQVPDELLVMTFGAVDDQTAGALYRPDGFLRGEYDGRSEYLVVPVTASQVQAAALQAQIRYDDGTVVTCTDEPTGLVLSELVEDTDAYLTCDRRLVEDETATVTLALD